MMRLRNAEGVQVVVTDEKVAKLIAAGTYKAVPASEQPPKQKQTAEQKPKPAAIDNTAATAERT